MESARNLCAGAFRDRCHSGAGQLEQVTVAHLAGHIVAVQGPTVESVGLSSHLSIGDRTVIRSRLGSSVAAEVVGFRAASAHLMMFGDTDGLGHGAVMHAQLERRSAALSVSDAWMGRVIDPLGRPLDGKGALASGPSRQLIRSPPPEPTRRARLGGRIDLGVCALNTFATCRSGQRIGLFAGSGVGKSTLLAMLARYTACDVAVLALVGERGREVREFIEDELGSDGLTHSVVVVATSDMPALMRREGAYAAMAVAEHFRDQGKNVLFLMDSVTRFCLALREIGLAAGEVPATRGYPPSVFAELPRLLERAGPGVDHPTRPGQITGFFTVLVEGDDHNEPVADAVRGILDGHVVLDRHIGERGRYPAVDVLRSLSRAASSCNSEAENEVVRKARRILSLHADIADLVRLGAYRRGADEASDDALAAAPRIEAAIAQRREERVSIDQGFERLREAMLVR